MLRTLGDLLQKDLTQKYVMVRIDANVEYVDDGVIDDLEGFRLDKSIETITALRNAGARIILVAHMGRTGQKSLEPIITYFKKRHGLEIKNLGDPFSNDIEDQLRDLDIGLIKNIRYFKQEEENGVELYEKLASLADYYVNEAFPVSHREHASVVGVPSVIGGFLGINCQHEYQTLQNVSSNLDTTLVVIGGAKFKTKLDLIIKALEQGSFVFVGGALAHTIYKARGFNIGTSLYDDVDVSTIAHDQHLVVPEFVMVKNNDIIKEKHISDTTDTDMIVDMAPRSAEQLDNVITSHDFNEILWNGPMGWYEEGFVDGTKAIAQSIIKSNTHTIIGGGDTVYVMQKYAPEILKQFNFVSTGGGALLDLVIDGSLPGITILERS